MNPSWIVETFKTYHIYRNEEGCDFIKNYTEDELFSLQGPYYSEEELNLRIKVLKSLKNPKEFKEMNQAHKRFWIVKISDDSPRYEYYPNATKSQVDDYLKTTGKIDKAEIISTSDDVENSNNFVKSLKTLFSIDTIILDQEKSNWIVNNEELSKNYLFIDKTWLEVYNHVCKKDTEGTINGPYTWDQIKEEFMKNDYPCSTWEI